MKTPKSMNRRMLYPKEIDREPYFLPGVQFIEFLTEYSLCPHPFFHVKVFPATEFQVQIQILCVPFADNSFSLASTPNS
jgi:hypothetical protein